MVVKAQTVFVKSCALKAFSLTKHKALAEPMARKGSDAAAVFAKLQILFTSVCA